MNHLQTIIDRRNTFTLLNAASGGPVSQDLTGQAIHFLNQFSKNIKFKYFCFDRVII